MNGSLYFRERPGWGCSPCTRLGGDTFPSCARTLTCPGLRLSARQLSGQYDVHLPHLLFCYALEHWCVFIKLITCFWQEGVSEKCTSEGYSCDWYDHYQGTSSLKGPSQFCDCTPSFVHEFQWSLNIFRASRTCRRLSIIGSRSPTFFHRGQLVTLIEISVGIGVSISNQYS